MTPHRLRIFAGLLLAPIALSAQSTPVSSTTPAAPITATSAPTPTEDPVQLEAVEVTGSRLRLGAGEAPAVPVFTITQLELEELGVNRLADIRQAIPQLAPAIGFNDNLGNSGPSRGQMANRVNADTTRQAPRHGPGGNFAG